MPSKYSRSSQAIYPIGPSIAYIPLNRGLWAIIESEDIERTEKYLWTASHAQPTYAVHYFRDSNGKRVCTGLHCFLTGKSGIDHKNRNGLDNRKNGNIRYATHSQNQHNKSKSRNNTSGFKGVTWNCGRAMWQATIMKDNRRRFLGYFEHPEVAGAAYISAARELHGEFAHD